MKLSKELKEKLLGSDREGLAIGLGSSGRCGRKMDIAQGLG